MEIEDRTSPQAIVKATSFEHEEQVVQHVHDCAKYCEIGKMADFQSLSSALSVSMLNNSSFGKRDSNAAMMDLIRAGSTKGVVKCLSVLVTMKSVGQKNQLENDKIEDAR